LIPLREVFPGLTVRGYQLFGMARRVMRLPRVIDSLDRVVLGSVPPLEKWCRYMVLTLPVG
jgi:hypothetical protein